METFDSNSNTISNPGGNTPPPAPASPDQQAAVTSQDSSVQQTAPQFQNSANAATATPGPQQQPNGQKLLSNPPAQAGDHQDHPLVQKAGVVNSVARALAGNPTRVTIDPDGTRRVEQVPLSRGQVALAIAMEAIQGSLVGLAAGRGRGPGAAGTAAMSQQIAQKQQEQNRQEEIARQQFSDRSSALAQQASSYAANLRTRALAQEVGMRDEESHKQWISQHASTAAYIRDNQSAAIVKDAVPESEITTPEFTKQALQNGWVAIPVSYAPRFDAQGNHFTDDGEAMHNDLYMVVDPGKLAGGRVGVPPDVVQKAQEWALPGFANSQGQPIRHMEDLELRIGTVLDTSNKIAVLEQEQKDLNGYYQFLSDKGVKDQDGKPLAAPDLKQLVRKNPSLISYVTGPWANHFGESPSAALKAMKDNLPAKGPISNLYGGQQMLDKYDLLKDLDKKGSEKTLEANIEVGKERALIPIHAANAKAEAQAKADVASASSHLENGDWNPASLPVGLVEGTVDPSQLSKRGATYTAQLEDANRYSLSKYGKPFDIAKAQADFGYAKNSQTQNTLRMINGMTEPGGAIQIADDAAKKLPQLNSSLLNKVFNAAATEFGSSEASDFHTAMLGLADEYSKIMGGGISSDTGRQQSLDLLKAAYSKGQLAGAIAIMRKDIAARKSAIVGDNRYLQRQFGGSPASVSNTQSPPVSLLKEGVNTTFQNGQTWTLQNGQPVQVK
jgi:hypothetical protein